MSESQIGCYVPECSDDATETYADGFKNELPLCEKHYYEAVYPGVRVNTVSKTVKRKTGSQGPISKLLGVGNDE